MYNCDESWWSWRFLKKKWYLPPTLSIFDAIRVIEGEDPLGQKDRGEIWQKIFWGEIYIDLPHFAIQIGLSTDQELLYHDLLDVVSQVKQGIDMCLSATSKLSKQVDSIKISAEENKQAIQTLSKDLQNKKNYV